jgi:two-component system NarL family sensor kinase
VIEMPYEVASASGACLYRGDDLELACEIHDAILTASLVTLVPPPVRTPVREPEKLKGWLSTTMRRECIRLVNRNRGEPLTVDWTGEDFAAGESPDVTVLSAERDAALWAAVERLPAPAASGLLALMGSLVAVAWLVPPVHQVGSWERAVADILPWLVLAAIGIAVLQYRLDEIDRIVYRTIAYAALTGCVSGAYLLAVTLLGAVFQQRSGLMVTLAASVLVAAFCAPLQARLQRAVDRLLYGQPIEPFEVMSRLGSRLEAAMTADDVLPTIVETVGQALKLPYVAIELHRDSRFEPVCVRGNLTGEPVEFPLAYRGDPLGRLVVGPRAPGEPYSPSDQRLLRDLARHAGIAVHSLRLTADLQRSQERLVTAREEERRRLRRDLHDGLGPTLAGVAFRVEAACRVLPTEPERAMDLLEKLKIDVEQALVEVRSVVEALRPPAIDELGLVCAIRQYGARFGGTGAYHQAAAGPIAMDVRAPASMPQIPAAIEVAVYRIATEAITNVLRHADARHCKVDIRLNDALELEVVDDGRGMGSAGREGVGLSSMRERAAELGGSCVVESTTAGTRVFVRLPITLEG